MQIANFLSLKKKTRLHFDIAILGHESYFFLITDVVLNRNEFCRFSNSLGHTRNVSLVVA